MVLGSVLDVHVNLKYRIRCSHLSFELSLLIHYKLTWIWPWGSRLGLRKYSSNHFSLMQCLFSSGDQTIRLTRWTTVGGEISKMIWLYESCNYFQFWYRCWYYWKSCKLQHVTRVTDFVKHWLCNIVLSWHTRIVILIRSWKIWPYLPEYANSWFCLDILNQCFMILDFKMMLA